jgi:hypothetical protein
MDKHNLFLTRQTYNLVRLDYFVILSALVLLLFMHVEEVQWKRFFAAFLWPDLVGTFPGMYWYYRCANCIDGRRSLPRVFYILYNVGHNLLVNAAILLAWYAITNQWEWAMLAIPIHLASDRAIFGNIYKEHGLAFEPVQHPLFAKFMIDYGDTGPW